VGRDDGGAGEAAGAERRQSHERVKSREWSFYVPRLFSFSFFLVVEIFQDNANFRVVGPCYFFATGPHVSAPS
jgi:hypothetical protein